MDDAEQKENRRLPNVYLRLAFPDGYIKKIAEKCARVFVDPWPEGEEEPAPKKELALCDVLLTAGHRDTLRILRQAPRMSWIQSISVGVDKMLTRAEVMHSDVTITNAKGTSSVPIAEHAMAMMLALTKKIPQMVRRQDKHHWSELQVRDVAGATVAIIGYGSIGHELALRCKAFGMRVIGCRRHPERGNSRKEPVDAIVGMDQLDRVLAQSDYTVLSLPATRETTRLFNRGHMEKMKPGSFLINIGRGDTVVADDLMACLRTGHLAGAALDVFTEEPLPTDHPLWTMNQVIISPHCAYYSSHYLDRSISIFLENLERFANGRPLINVVDKVNGY